MKTVASALIAATLSVVSAEDNTHTQKWLYTETSVNRGPSNWGSISGNEVCGTGTSQSPINIASAQIDSTLQQLQFSYSATSSYAVLNNQHSEEVLFSSSPGYFIDPALGNKRWNAAQFHVHSPSENGIGGGLYDMELHIVHTPDDVETGSTTEYGYAVVSILFEASSNSPNKFLDNFWEKLQPLPISQADHYANPDQTYTYNTVDGTVEIDISDLLTTSEYYTFDGSLTTPPCTEGVKWYVLSVPNTMSASQLEFHNNQMDFGGLKAVTENGVPVGPPAPVYGNNRPLQPLNSRIVKRFAQSIETTIDDDDDDDKTEDMSIAALIIASVALLFVFIFGIVCCLRSGNSSQVSDDKSSSGNKPDDVDQE
eukprot:TRINITY_DN15589_c0_g1_i1.p1 TRINITY_DN15589_c0_g1~~TRINITY_DN15589_c0_g1_i1.p1  ORF type:complete len:369 (+),score=69.71 TRINITY_DN15589_c0_g1_i1:56-1162(+)